MMIDGGFNNISKEGSFEFANMKATSNHDTETEFAMGHELTEMSCPITTSRAVVSYLIHYKTKTNFFISLWNLKYVALNFGSHLIHMLYRVLVSISL